MISGAATKFGMFMRHKIRARSQGERINEIFEWTKNGAAKNRLFLFLYFKVKVDPERLRDSQIRFYGKSGMSWYGSAIC